MNDAIHIPVLRDQVMQWLNVREGSTLVDVTAGAGGHLALMAEATGPKGRVIAFDRDERAHQDDAAGGVAKEYADRVTLVKAPFHCLREELDKLGIKKIDGLLADLGVSSMQLDEKSRGFSFQTDGPLDMRMDTSSGESARVFIDGLTEKELADVIYEYGDEHRSRRIAKAIKSHPRAPDGTLELAEWVSRSVGGRRGKKTHPATKTFQALRIAVNRELHELDALLNDIPHVLAPKGRACIISFHSLEDRKVKVCFREEKQKKRLIVLTKKPLVATPEEERQNPRARSAKLRVVEMPEAGLEESP